MQINSFQNINFKSKFGYDDSISSERRKYIRSHLEGDTFQRTDIFLNNPRLEEYELNKLLNSLTGKNDKVVEIDSAIMRNIPLYNVRKIYGTNSYKGSTEGMSDRVCKQLKKAGIKRVISFLVFPGDNIENCKNNGLETYWYPIGADYWNSDMFKSEETIRKNTYNEWCYYLNENEFKEILDSNLESWRTNKKAQIEKFVNFIQIMQKENVYVGCACAIGRTEALLALNYFFNQKASKTKCHFPYKDCCIAQRLMNLYKNLTPEDKIKMGWTQEFDKSFIQRLKQFAPEVEN